MTAKAVERAAYIAAHRILDANMIASELACPGARRSFAVDRIAEIIRDAMEIHVRETAEAATWSGIRRQHDVLFSRE